MKLNLFVCLVLLYAFGLILTACSPSPLEVVNSWQQAVNNGNIEQALSYLAEDATVTIIPPGEGDGVYNGHDEIRGWYEILTSGKGTGELSNCVVEGETISCLSTYRDEGLKSLGVDFLEGDFVAVVKGGKIRSYSFTTRPESLAKFPPPPESEPPTPTALPETRLTSPDALVGKWQGKSEEYLVLHQFQADGTVRIFVSGVGLISTSRYWFEDDLLKFNDMTGDCQGIVGSYEVYATYSSEIPVKLRFVLVGDDACKDRKDTLAGKTMLPP